MGYAGLMKSPGSRIIELLITGIKAKKLNDDDFALNPHTFFGAIEKRKSTFIHEFTHYLDSKRIGLEKWHNLEYGGSWDDEGVFHGDEKYYNSAHEYNAFYQGLVSRIDSYIASEKRKAKKAIEKFYVGDYNQGVEIRERDLRNVEFEIFGTFGQNAHDFINTIAKQITGYYLKQLNPKMKKKMLARLYGYYDEVIAPQKEELLKTFRKKFEEIEFNFQKHQQILYRVIEEALKNEIKVVEQQPENQKVAENAYGNIYLPLKDFPTLLKSVMENHMFTYNKEVEILFTSLTKEHKKEMEKELRKWWNKVYQPLVKKLLSTIEWVKMYHQVDLKKKTRFVKGIQNKEQKNLIG